MRLIEMLMAAWVMLVIQVGVSNQLDWQAESVYCRVRCILPYPNCAESTDDCFEGQIFILNGSYCGCCDACYTISDEGDFCGTHQEYYQYVKCKEGLTCDRLFQICLNYTSIIQLIHLQKPKTNTTTSLSTVTEATTLLSIVNSTGTELPGNFTNLTSTIPSTNKRPRALDSYEDAWKMAFESFSFIFTSVQKFFKFIG